MKEYTLNSLEHQAMRSFFRRQSDMARRRRRCEDLVGWGLAGVGVTIISWLLYYGF